MAGLVADVGQLHERGRRMGTASFEPGFDPYVHRGVGQVSEDIFDRVHAVCLGLPEVTTRVDECRDPTRSSVWTFDIRRRGFCMLVHTEDPTGTSASVLVLRAEPIERAALLSMGHPFFEPLGGPDRLGVVLTDETDWVEVRELLTESYRRLAPKKLIAKLG